MEPVEAVSGNGFGHVPFLGFGGREHVGIGEDNGQQGKEAIRWMISVFTVCEMNSRNIVLF